MRDCGTEEETHNRLEMLLNLTPQGVFWIGGDLGYTNDPTEIVVFREQEVGERPVLRMVLRIRSAWPTRASPRPSLCSNATSPPTDIGVDNGSNGLAVVQELLTLDKHKPLQLEGRLRGYDFGGITTLVVRDGRVVYSKGNDHIIDAVRCAMLVREQGRLDQVGKRRSASPR